MHNNIYMFVYVCRYSLFEGVLTICHPNMVVVQNNTVYACCKSRGLPVYTATLSPLFHMKRLKVGQGVESTRPPLNPPIRLCRICTCIRSIGPLAKNTLTLPRIGEEPKDLCSACIIRFMVTFRPYDNLTYRG